MDLYKKSGTIFTLLSKKLDLMMGYNINSQSLMEYFSKEYDDKILNGTNYEKEIITNNRIKYFKEYGIDLGDYYNLI